MMPTKKPKPKAPRAAKTPKTLPTMWKSRIVEHADVAPADLLPHPENWRKHGVTQRAAIEAALNTIGWVQSVVVNKRTGRIIDGHLRVVAALEHGEATVPVGYVTLTDAEERIALATLDPIGAMAETSRTALEALFGRIDQSSDEVRRLLLAAAAAAKVTLATAARGEDDAPARPAPRDQWVPAGSLWRLGEHRLLCGDSLDPAALARLMDGERAGMCFTDPPWRVAIVGGSHALSPEMRRARGGKAILNDEMSAADFAAFLGSVAARLAEVVTGDLYCVMGSSEWPTIDAALRAAGYHWSATIAWVKPQQGLTRRKYHTRYEPIWYGWPEKGKSSFVGGRGEDDVWEVPRPARSEEHPTMKPVALVERAIRNSSEPGAIVLDPFVGSGTTIIASERLARRCFAVDLDPQYAQVSLERWQNYTGQMAERIG